VPFSDLLDTVEITLGDDIAPDAGDTWPHLLISDKETARDDSSRTEPTLAAAPFLIEFDEPAWLDPTRIGLTWELPAASSPAPRWRSSLGALAVHVLPLLMILAWPATATEAPVIPVRLVLEEPPPDPPPAPAQPPQPQPPPPPSQPKPGRLASEDLGAVKPKTAGKASPAPNPAPAQKKPLSQPAETKVATASPPPLLPPKSVPPKEQSAAVRPPQPSVPTQSYREETPHETPHEAPRPARYEGPGATRDDYLAYLVTLTRQHIDLLPMSVVGTRRGETQLAIAVQDDGTILRISVYRGSGYPDIDERIERMVAAVGRFPPVPQWFRGHTLEVTLTLQFPEALGRP
jgi:outer membrane biosynthesis protein TonB